MIFLQLKTMCVLYVKQKMEIKKKEYIRQENVMLCILQDNIRINNINNRCMLVKN